MSESNLIPPDYNRCQCEITEAHGPFVLGPKPRPARCHNEPVYIAVETIPGRDGRCGAMSLCLSCAKVMLDDENLAKRVQLQPIVRKSEIAHDQP